MRFPGILAVITWATLFSAAAEALDVDVCYALYNKQLEYSVMDNGKPRSFPLAVQTQTAKKFPDGHILTLETSEGRQVTKIYSADSSVEVSETCGTTTNSQNSRTLMARLASEQIKWLETTLKPKVSKITGSFNADDSAAALKAIADREDLLRKECQ